MYEGESFFIMCILFSLSHRLSHLRLLTKKTAFPAADLTVDCFVFLPSTHQTEKTTYLTGVVIV